MAGNIEGDRPIPGAGEDTPAMDASGLPRLDVDPLDIFGRGLKEALERISGTLPPELSSYIDEALVSIKRSFQSVSGGTALVDAVPGTGEAAPVVRHDAGSSTSSEGFSESVRAPATGVLLADRQQAHGVAGASNTELDAMVTMFRGAQPSVEPGQPAPEDGIGGMRARLRAVSADEIGVEQDLMVEAEIVPEAPDAIKVNSYERGRVKSLEYKDANGHRVTDCVMQPGKYTFSTGPDTAEIILVTQGELKLHFRGGESPIELKQGMQFTVPAGTTFIAKTGETATAYHCIFKPVGTDKTV